MSRGIAVHVVAGILFVGVGTSDAQESIPRRAVVESRYTLTNTGVLPTRNDSSSPNNDMLEPGVLSARLHRRLGVTVAIAPNMQRDAPNDNIERRQNSDGSPRVASDSPQAKAVDIRKFTRRYTLGELVQIGALTPETADDSLALFGRSRTSSCWAGRRPGRRRCSANALAAHIPDSDRVIVIEETSEIHLNNPNVLRLEARRAQAPLGQEAPLPPVRC